MKYNRLIPFQEKGKKKSGKRLLFFLLLIIGISIFAYIIFSIGLEQLIQVWQSSRLSLIGLAILIYLSVLFIRSLKWFFLLKGKGLAVPWLTIAPCYFTNIFFSDFTPAKSGEAMAPFLLKSYGQVPKRYGLSVLILERAADTLVFLLVVIFVSGYLYTQKISSNLPVRQIALIACLLWAVGFAFLITFMIKAVSITRWLDGIGRKYKGRLGWLISKIAGWARPLAQGFQEMARPGSLLICTGLSILDWVLEFFYLFVLINAITPITFLHSLCCQAFAITASLASLIPGGVGIGPASYLSLAVILGYPKISIAAAVLLNSFLIHALRVTLGALSFGSLHYFYGSNLRFNDELISKQGRPEAS